MNNAMNDFKPVFRSDYTGRRHDDPLPAMPAGSVGILSFIAGMMFMAIIDLLMRGLTL